MGRPRIHATHAQRQAAYRVRRAQADAAAITDLEVRAERLRCAMEAADAARDPLARKLYGGTAAASIGNLALWFERQAEDCREAARAPAAAGSDPPAASPAHPASARKRPVTTKRPRPGQEGDGQ